MAASRPFLRWPGGIYCGGHSAFVAVATGSWPPLNELYEYDIFSVFTLSAPPHIREQPSPPKMRPFLIFRFEREALLKFLLAIGARRVECPVCTDMADRKGVFLCVNPANMGRVVHGCDTAGFLSTDIVTQQ